MDQKRLENIEKNKDVCLNENNNNKKRSRIYAYLMNCAAPMLTVIFVALSVCWTIEIQYGDKEEFDKNPEAAAVLAPNGILPQMDVHVEPALPNPEIIEESIVNSGAELVEACGVYVNNEFVGAIVNADPVESELELVLDDYKSDENVIQADYAVEAELKQGVYRSAALVSEDTMTDYLTGEKEVVKEYKADSGDTPEKLADDFGMTVEEVKELNPEIEKIEKGEPVKVKEKVSVMPVKYTCAVTEEEPLDCQVTLAQDDDTTEKGKRIKEYEVTYIDGTEIMRRLKRTETVLELDVKDEDSNEADELQTESIPESDDVMRLTETFIWPVNGGYVSDPFMSDRNHKGMDIAADYGTDIYASGNGTVVESGWNDGGYGYSIVIDHGNGYKTRYAHASELFVEEGKKVSTGDVIATVGSTGDSTGNHCHFEVIYEGSFLNPVLFIGE